MSDKPREWPNKAKMARDLAALEAMAGIRSLRAVVEGERAFTESERLRREARALISLQEIARLLAEQGAAIDR